MPTLLKLQIGPVQDFIAQARSTRDLWSGSYLLSWLMGVAIKKLAQQLREGNGGMSLAKLREVVIFPDLAEQGLIEFLLQDHRFSERGRRHFDILTPNLPNVLVTRLPDERANAIAEALESAIREEWAHIGEKCWRACLVEGFVRDMDRPRFEAQRDRFLSVAWQTTPCPTSKEGLPAIGVPGELWKKACEAFNKGQPYALHYALCSWLHDGVRQCRPFRAWQAGGWTVAESSNKDSLTGREEEMLGGTEWWQKHFSDAKRAERHRRDPDNLWSILIRERHAGDRLGAITMSKRLWHWKYLYEVHGLPARHRKEQSQGRTEFPFPSTFHIATHQPWSNDDEDDRQPDDESDRLANYFAVLAFDGDNVGQWVLGAKLPEAMTEEQHKDFSARLSKFALSCARPIVDACDGRLIYAGGDDVLALVPADTAIACARFLRGAYRAETATSETGFLSQLRDLARSLRSRFPEPDVDTGLSPYRRLAAEGQLFKDWPSMVGRLPGSYANLPDDQQPEASVGVAIAHFKHPLQDVVAQAQAAERRAKGDVERGGLGKAALAVTLLKRSGETVEWGTKWTSQGIELLELLGEARRTERISARFPYRLIALLSAYSGAATRDAAAFPAAEVIQREFAHVVRQQKGPKFEDEFAQAASDALQRHLHEIRQLPVQPQLQSVIGLCQTLAFTVPPRQTAEAKQPAATVP